MAYQRKNVKKNVIFEKSISFVSVRYQPARGKIGLNTYLLNELRRRIFEVLGGFIGCFDYRCRERV